jgi:glycerate kinase
VSGRAARSRSATRRSPTSRSASARLSPAAAPVLVGPDDFTGSLTAAEVASALTAGLRAGGLEAEELPVADARAEARVRHGVAYLLDAVGFDERMRGSRFVVTGADRLDEQSLAGDVVSEVATRCHGAGVGCHAVVGENRLSAFERRLLDLASVTEATTLDELRAAGRKLAEAA